MILDTMTLEELIREIKTDFKEVSGRWNAFSPKFRKTIRKRTQFPWLWDTTIKTRRHNEWYLSFYAMSKKEANIVTSSLTLLFTYQGKPWAGTVVDGQVFLFPSHFFDRYRERFLKIHSEQVSMSGKDMMKLFFILNSNCCFFGNEKGENVRGYCYDGMIFGDWINEDGGIAKTFISRQEMKINQFAEYFELLKIWIIQDMFKARKGIPLCSPLTKFVPDTYFDYGEWNKFLFERGNLRLIRAAVESNEIYLKNEQEYRKCLKMVDTVIQNRYEKQFGLQP